VHSGVKTLGISSADSSPGQVPVPERMAMSTFSRVRSVRVEVVSTRTARPGLAIWNSPSRWASHWLAKVARVVIDSTP
jgi:hypothetical protein